MLDAIDHREEIAKLTYASKNHETRINTLEVAHTDSKQAFELLIVSVGELKTSVDAVIAHVKPMVDREEKAKSFILKWSIPTIGVLLLTIIAIVWLGDYATEIGEFVKAVK